MASCKTNLCLIYSPDQVNNSYIPLDTIKKVRPDNYSDSLVVRMKNRKKSIVHHSTIWGVKDGDIYLRYYNREFFHLKQLDTLIIYSKSNNSHKNPKTDYFFSKKLDSEIFYLNEKNLKNEFKADTCFLNGIDRNLKWYQTYHSYNRKNKMFRIMGIYKKCTTG